MPSYYHSSFSSLTYILSFSSSAMCPNQPIYSHSAQINTPQHALPYSNLRIRYPHRSSSRSLPFSTRPKRIPPARTLAPSKYRRLLYLVFPTTGCERSTLFEWNMERCCGKKNICAAAWRYREWWKGFIWIGRGVVLEWRSPRNA